MAASSWAGLYTTAVAVNPSSSLATKQDCKLPKRADHLPGRSNRNQPSYLIAIERLRQTVCEANLPPSKGRTQTFDGIVLGGPSSFGRQNQDDY
jgi:surfactin synthase thioesterase subunit